ncbi:MAG: glycosyltransferase family 4 protein [Acidobacteria bacterium]|nr:glycosyltransferase family 4 protein [Acidobacteriota bacterium]
MKGGAGRDEKGRGSGGERRARILLDARALLGPRTGVGTWTVQVASGLARRFGWEVELAAHERLDLPRELRCPEVHAVPPPRRHLPGTLWLQWQVPGVVLERGAGVFIGSLAMVPRRCPIPSVVVVHDLTPRTMPGRHTLKNRWCFNAYLEASLEQAARVVAVSHATLRELAGLFPWTEDRARVIRNGVSERFEPLTDDRDADRTRLRYANGRPYILHLGTLEPRKGIPTLVRAWEALKEREVSTPDLVLAGKEGWGLREVLDGVTRSAFRQAIHLPGHVSDAAAVELLQHAELFVLASEAEGFGLPLAEAICCGAPCVASDIPVFREVGGDAALYAPVRDPRGLAAVMEKALREDVRTGLRRAAALRAPDLRWDRAIFQWNELLEEILARD